MRKKGRVYARVGVVTFLLDTSGSSGLSELFLVSIRIVVLVQIIAFAVPSSEQGNLGRFSQYLGNRNFSPVLPNQPWFSHAAAIRSTTGGAQEFSKSWWGN